MNNTIIQEKVKEFEKKFIKEAQTCDKADCDNELAMGCQNPNHQIRYKYLNGGYEDVKNFLEQALTSLVKEVREEEKKSEKANIEKHMVYLFRRLPEWFVQKPRYMSKQKKDSLWGNMCTWTNQYIADLKSK